MPDKHANGGLLWRIAERAINRPLLIHPDKLPIILGVLHGRIPISGVDGMIATAEQGIAALPPEAQEVMRGKGPAASRFVGERTETDDAGNVVGALPYRRTKDGVAVITIVGSLINRGAWVGSWSGETSYEGIQHQLAAVAQDPKSHSVILDIESPGGEGLGAFETAAAVRALNAQKPVTAVVNGMAASAGYAIASGARRIVTNPSGVSGSIGVVMLHADFSRQLDKEGITPTFIFSGAHKVDGNCLEPLPESVRADLQRECDQFYDLFVDAVASGRKMLSPKAIRATEARMYIGQDAVSAGLADEIGTFNDVLADLSASNVNARSRAFSKGASMSKTTGEPGANEPGNTVTKTEHDTAMQAARTEGHTAGRAEGLAEGAKNGAKAANERVAKILGDEKTKGKERIALDLAMKSPDMSADDVVAFVAGVAPAGRSIEQRMQGQGADLALGKPMQSAQADDNGWGAVVTDVNAKASGARK